MSDIVYDPATHDAGGPQVGLLLVRAYVQPRWGGADLGCYVYRNVRGGSSLSLHAEGRAWDWRAPSRKALDEAIALMVANAVLLNVQRLTDYGAKRSWDCRYPGDGWKSFTGFSPGDLYWHIERNWEGATDKRAVADIIATPPGPAPAPRPRRRKAMLFYGILENTNALFISDGVWIRLVRSTEDVAALDTWHTLNTQKEKIMLPRAKLAGRKAVDEATAQALAG